MDPITAGALPSRQPAPRPPPIARLPEAKGEARATGFSPPSFEHSINKQYVWPLVCVAFGLC